MDPLRTNYEPQEYQTRNHKTAFLQIDVELIGL